MFKTLRIVLVLFIQLRKFTSFGPACPVSVRDRVKRDGSKEYFIKVCLGDVNLASNTDVSSPIVEVLRLKVQHVRGMFKHLFYLPMKYHQVLALCRSPKTTSPKSSRSNVSFCSHTIHTVAEVNAGLTPSRSSSLDQGDVRGRYGAGKYFNTALLKYTGYLTVSVLLVHP